MRNGEIWVVDFPLSCGHEQHGLRPVLVLSKQTSGIIIVVPFTSNLQAIYHAFTFKIAPSKSNGLNVDSVALVFQLRAIDKIRLKNKIGTIENRTLKKINKMIRKLLFI